MVDLIDLLIKRARKGLYGQNKNVHLDPLKHSKNKKMIYVDAHVPLRNKEKSLARQVLGVLPKKVIIGFAKKIHKKKWIFADLTWEY